MAESENSQWLLQGESEPEYNPYKIPPDIQAAKLHCKAKRVSVAESNCPKYCPCCNFPIENKGIPFFCEEKELSFLGSAYPFYFRYSKAVAKLVFVLLIMGFLSAYFAYSRGECINYCVKILGFTVFSDGNLSAQLNNMSWYNLFSTIAMLIIIFNIKSHLYEEMRFFNEELHSSSRFTLMVQNIPRQTNKSELIAYFEKLTNSKVEKINFGYDIAKYRKFFDKKLKFVHKMANLKEKLKKDNQNLEDSQLKIKEMEGEILYLEQKMAAFEESCVSESSENFLGTAFVTFNNQLPIKVLLEHYGVTYIRNLKYLLLSRWTAPYLKFKNKCLMIHRAPEPTDILWENLQFSFWKSFLNSIVMYFAAVMILFLSFFIQWKVVKVVYGMRVAQNISFFSDSWIVRIKSLLSSIAIATTNFLLRITVFAFTIWQRRYSNTKQNKTYINVYVILSFFNCALMPYLINTFLYDHSSFQLILDIHFILLTNAIATPLSRLFDIVFLYKIAKRMQIERKGRKCTYPQHWVNEYFENPTMDIADSYSYMSRLLLVSAWFASAAPLGIIMSLTGVFVTYGVDKFLLLKVQSMPTAQNEDIISSIVNVLELVPYIYIFGAIEFTVRLVVSENLVDFLVTFMVYAASSVSLMLTLAIYVCFYKKAEETKPFSKTLEYSSSKWNLFGDYDRVNPLTQKAAFAKFLQELKEASDQNGENQIIIETAKRFTRHRSFTRSIEVSTSNNIVMLNQRKSSGALNDEIEMTPRNLIGN